jgi:hypothetical protein
MWQEIDASLLHMQVGEYAEELKKAGVEEMLEKVQDKSIQYPEYYLKRFHVRSALHPRTTLHCVPHDTNNTTLIYSMIRYAEARGESCVGLRRR